MQRLAFVVLMVVAACGGGSSSSNPDAGNPDGAGGGGGPAEFGTPAGTWTYVPIAGTQCMNGTATGIGVNQGTSGDLVIYLEGGGACFNTVTCASVAHQGGFGASDFAATIADYSTGMFNRTDAKNPLKDATFVFVPYCTGDVHAGSNPTGFGDRKQVGFINMGKDLEYILPKATKVGRVVLAGSSAGGFGAMFNYDRTQTAFGDKPVTLIDDSGPPLSDKYLTPCLQKQMRQYWNLDAAIPAGCTVCNKDDGGGLGDAASFVADKYKNRRLALITSTRDGVIRSFLGFGYPDCQTGGNPMPEPDYAAAIKELRDTTLTAHTNFRVFTKESGLHVWLLTDPLSTVTSGGTDLDSWLTSLLDPGSDWKSVAP
jgi:hypothetical protein